MNDLLNRNGLTEHIGFMLGILVGGLILYQLLFYFFKQWTRKKKHFIPDLLQQHIYHPGLVLIILITLLAGLPFLREFLYERLYSTLHHILVILVIAASGMVLIQAITVTREILVHHYQAENPRDYTVRKARTKFQLIQRVLNFLIILATISIALMTFQSIRQLGTSLLASAGVVGLVLGFAAQKSIGTLFAGIQIAISQPIRIDDVVVVEDQFGTIGEITLTYVVVNSWDGRRLVVPINYFLENSFENWTMVSPDVIGKVKIYTDYSLPVAELREEFMKWVEASGLWDKRAAALLVTDADEKTIELRVTMSARNADDAWEMECLIREKLIAHIQEKYPYALPKSRLAMHEGNDPSLKKKEYV